MTTATSTKPRRRTGRLPLPRTVAGRRRLTAATVLLAAAAAGFLVTFIAYPRPLFRTGNLVTRVIGLPIDQAEQELRAAGFKVKVEGEEPDPEVPAGRVLWQDPPPELIAPKGTIVNLIRSTGPAPVPVPDVTDFELEQATRVILAAGLRLGAVDTVPASEDAGIVVGVRPQPGSGRPPGSAITLVVSQGPATIEVPTVVGLRVDEARKQLEASGLKVGRVSRNDARRGPPGTVLEQRPQAGASTTRQARVDLIVTGVN